MKDFVKFSMKRLVIIIAVMFPMNFIYIVSQKKKKYKIQKILLLLYCYKLHVKFSVICFPFLQKSQNMKKYCMQGVMFFVHFIVRSLNLSVKSMKR